MQTNKPPVDKFLNDSERKMLRQFHDNETMREAVKKVFLWEIYNDGVLIEGEPADPRRNAFHQIAMTHDDATKVGQRCMALSEGLNALEKCFKSLSDYATPEEKVVEPKTNQAR